MKNKDNAVFLGVYECPKCGKLATHNALPERNRVPLVFGITGIPVWHTVRKFASCSHCGYRRKLKGELKEAYKRALENNFDDKIVVDRFVNKIEETCIMYNVLSNGTFDEYNFEKAVDEIYGTYAAVQGYNREFYSSLCRVFSVQAEFKIKQYNLMFRSKF